MNGIALVTEDELSEAIGQKLLQETGALKGRQPMLLRKGGYGYIYDRMRVFPYSSGNLVFF